MTSSLGRPLGVIAALTLQYMKLRLCFRQSRDCSYFIPTGISALGFPTQPALLLLGTPWCTSERNTKVLPERCVKRIGCSGVKCEYKVTEQDGSYFASCFNEAYIYIYIYIFIYLFYFLILVSFCYK